MTGWNFADVWAAVAEVFPDRPALAQGGRRVGWAAFDDRATSLAAGLVAHGLGRQAKVAQYLYNCPEYLESVNAAFKCAMVPVNTNYRYTENELVYLWDNADAEAVVFHGTFVERIESIRSQLPKVKLWCWVDDGTSGCPGWAVGYEEMAAAGEALTTRWTRSGDDLLFIYTGGTTGMPKGVMWRQDDLFATLNRTAEVRYTTEADGSDPAMLRATLRKPRKYLPGRLLPGPPLMHGTGLFTAMSVLASGGSVVMPRSRHLDAEEMLDLIQAEHITQMSIVGDAFAKPILAALDAQPARWDISSLWLIMSSGVMWSAEVKSGLLKHNPNLTLVDTLGSSEALGMATSTSRVGRAIETAGFELGADTKVITEAGDEVRPGSGETGRLAVRGRGPIGYYKDPDKSAATFLMLNGERWSVPGDFATVRADGSVQLLGRGSVCINTGGEKVYPEEVEEALKLHPEVADAVVVGVPDERFGETVTALVQPARPEAPDAEELIAWVKARLAGYKAPRHVVVVETIGRSPAGKVDYRRLREHATGVVKSRG
ncbi:MAG: acyl-CoA synthetase [Acidimicrobiales bacterium]|nr:acyl-CoA synthetase [Acidimicrobiales bacterium]